MEPLSTLIARHAQDGRLDWIGLRPARKAPVAAVPRAQITEAGLVGDHRARPGKRAVTLLQAEHLPAITSYTGRPAAPEMLRRNLVVAGVNLSALRGRRLAIGGVVLRLAGPCAPCSRMEETLGPGGYSALRGHGGWCAEVLTPGALALGDLVRPLPD